MPPCLSRALNCHPPGTLPSQLFLLVSRRHCCRASSFLNATAGKPQNSNNRSIRPQWRSAVAPQFLVARRGFRFSACLFQTNDVARKNHYDRLQVRTDASPAQIKKSFYSLSKTHHPDANRNDPNASETFSLLSESYTILSDPPRRAAYDRDVMNLHRQQQEQRHNHPRGSYHSTSNPAGGRAPSGLSRRRGTFRGPPPSFYRSGGWGTQFDKRRRAHEESTGGAANANPSASASQSDQHTDGGAPRSRYGGMGPGSDPFHYDEVFHFDKQSHTRTHQNQDDRRWQRRRRAVDEDDIEFEPQTSLGGHFLIVAGILGVTFLAPLVYLQFLRFGRRKKEFER